jgi:hypothetical protein
MNNTAEQLRAIRNFEDLIRYLEDELDWPLQEYGFEELTFEYTPEELGIKAQDAAKIARIHQLRPLYSGQPWGIFFVEFEHKKLPVVVLRRILSHLVVKKRTSANKSSAAAWNAEDLLFISAFGEEESKQREIAFAHFHQQPGDLPSLRVLGWDGADTHLKLAHVNRVLHERLRWPDKPHDQQAWREQWRTPFRHRLGHIIRTADALAEVLAQLARNIRDRAQTMLAAEADNGPLRTLHQAFRTSLIHDLSEESFADTYAQTITYGLLTAAISRTDRSEGRYGTFLNAESITDMVPMTNPFLREMLQTFLRVGGRKGGIDFDELGIQDVVELLRGDETDLDLILRDFGNRTRGEDPVIHFYEHFLAAYNKKLKVQRGVFYTPQPVVSYIVRSVHELLQTEFGLEDGLASTITWGEMTQKNLPLPPGRGVGEFNIPAGTDPNSPFVVILDPATGTATFLVEVIDVIYRTLSAKWRKQGMSDRQREVAWNDYVPKHLLPRLYGYELMMAPYAIAHMKIGLKLGETGYHFLSQERARIYLTNALEPASDDKKQMEFEEVLPALAHEAKAVNAVKRGQLFTVVIGNPPYSVSSWNSGIWISDLAEGYKRTVRKEETQIQALSNDYIKFLRFGEWHIAKAGVGALGFITGHGYLQGTQPRDLRNHLSSNFDRLYCLDLHGSLRRAGTDDAQDKPVFEITTGVAILVGFRRSGRLERASTVLKSVTGDTKKKFDFLSRNTALSMMGADDLHCPVAPYFYFSPSVIEQEISEEYKEFIELPTIFGTGNRQSDKEIFWATGFASQQDELAMSFTINELEQKMSALAESRSFDELKQTYRLCTTTQWNYVDAKEYVRKGLWRQHVKQVAYRPFDRQWTVLNKNVLTILRKQVMQQFDGKERNLGLISSRAVNDLQFAHCFVTNEPVDKIFISSKTSTNAYVFPLFFSEDDIFGQRRRPNFSRLFLKSLVEALNLKNEGNYGLPNGLNPEDIFCYIYAVLYSPSYRTRYAEFLKIDFPHIPLPGSPELFSELSQLGKELVSLHLLESPKINQLLTRYQGEGDHSIPKKPVYKNGAVWINATQRFENVPEAVWNFHIGGYQVCEKWLKDRKGRCLIEEDIVHYQKIVVALNETIRLMQEIDVVIDRHGGWPAAFQQAKNGGGTNDSEK